MKANFCPHSTTLTTSLKSNFYCCCWLQFTTPIPNPMVFFLTSRSRRRISNPPEPQIFHNVQILAFSHALPTRAAHLSIGLASSYKSRRKWCHTLHSWGVVSVCSSPIPMRSQRIVACILCGLLSRCACDSFMWTLQRSIRQGSNPTQTKYDVQWGRCEP